MAGYSGNPLIKKLGIKETSMLYLVNPPANYFDLLENSLQKQLTGSIEAAGIFHIFTKQKASLEKEFKRITSAAKDDAVIWISWYKKSAKIPTDITEEVIREIVLPSGWVDVKVCAVSDLWSGLKIVKRLKNRSS
ncbi:MAG TPA: hypothetical protein VHB48_01055 [Chitinophagaceae bacterium]|jgi:hypothetical protein|nr:hypothetical protein [Chitinophagaceae bacterium]